MAENVQNFGGDPQKVAQTEHFLGGDALIILKGDDIWGISGRGLCGLPPLKVGLVSRKRKM